MQNFDELQTELRKEFARMKAVDNRKYPDEIGSAIAVAAEKEPFSTRADRRVRYWVDGLVIGSELFVKTTMARARGIAAVKKRKLVRALNARSEKVDLYCFKQLRVLLE